MRKGKEKTAGIAGWASIIVTGLLWSVPSSGAENPQPPVAAPDSVTVSAGLTTVLDVLTNDRHPNGIPFRIISASHDDCAGLVTVSADGLRLLFAPDSGFATGCTVTYEVEDQLARTAQATVNVAAAGAPPSPTPLLTVHAENPRYFSDPDGNAVYLAGAHVWQNVQEYGNPPSTDCGGHECGEAEWDYLRGKGHNFTRGWHWEQEAGMSGASGWTFAPAVPFLKVGGSYDLYSYDTAYFDRLRDRVATARDRGLYVSVMLFEGHSIQNRQREGDDPWDDHPFNPGNNSTLGVNPDQDGDGGEEIHTLRFPEVTAVQEAYIARVIEELNAFDNVIWEICNECGDAQPNVSVSGAEVVAWMEAMAAHVKQVESTEYPVQHLVWMSAPYRDNVNSLLLASPSADVVALRGSAYQSPPLYNPAEGKIVLLDSDHIDNPTCLGEGAWCDTGWPWKSFTRGYHPVFMDTVRTLWPGGLEPDEDGDGDGVFDDPQGLVEMERLALGQTVHFANEVIQNLGAMVPRDDISTNGYCLANPGEEYLVFQPEAGMLSVELFVGDYTYELFDTRAAGGAGEVVETGSLTTPPNGVVEFDRSLDRWVLYLRRDAPPTTLVVSGPDDTTATDGDSASFTVDVSGGQGTITYVWEYSFSEPGPFDPVSGPEFSVLDTPAASTLTIDPVTFGNEGWYRCVVNDSASPSVTSATASLTVNPVEVCETPPIASTDSIVVVHGGPPAVISDEFILANDVGEDLSQPSNDSDWVVTWPDGTLISQIPGGWTYQAPADYQAFDSFEYKVISAGNESCFDVGTVEITIEPPTCDTTPVAVPDEITIPMNTTYQGSMCKDFLCNDTGIVTPQFGGIVDPQPQGMFTPHVAGGGDGYTFAPVHDFVGDDEFGYRVFDADNEACEAFGSVVVHVVDPDLSPVASFKPLCVGLTCTFDPSGSTDDFGIVSYQWDFGDGVTLQTASAAPVEHTYTTFGTVRGFVVRLTVIDTAGQEGSTKQPISPVSAAADGPYDVVYGSSVSLDHAVLLGNAGVVSDQLRMG